MKIVLLAITLAILSTQSHAQSNLQFNQILTYTGQISGLDSTNTWIVPTNKVWKIVSMSNLKNFNTASFILNGIPIKENVGSTYNETFYSPIWLKAGDVIKFKIASSIPLNYYLSIIEYNIIP